MGDASISPFMLSPPPRVRHPLRWPLYREKTGWCFSVWAAVRGSESSRGGQLCREQPGTQPRPPGRHWGATEGAGGSTQASRPRADSREPAPCIVAGSLCMTAPGSAPRLSAPISGPFLATTFLAPGIRMGPGQALGSAMVTASGVSPGTQRPVRNPAVSRGNLCPHPGGSSGHSEVGRGSRGCGRNPPDPHPSGCAEQGAPGQRGRQGSPLLGLEQDALPS